MRACAEAVAALQAARFAGLPPLYVQLQRSARRHTSRALEDLRTSMEAEGGEGSWSARLLRLRPAHIEAAAAAVHCSAAYILRVLRLSAEGAPPPSAPVQLASSMQLLGAACSSSPRRSATQPRGG